MTEEHHDPELCKRLAKNIMKWTRAIPLRRYWDMENSEGKGIISFNDWDPCCNPAHSWMLEQRMAELGWYYEGHRDWAVFMPTAINSNEISQGRNRLHATAIAADVAVEV